MDLTEEEKDNLEEDTEAEEFTFAKKDMEFFKVHTE